MSSQSKAYSTASSGKTINVIGLKFDMVIEPGMDNIPTKFQLSSLIASMVFIIMVPIFGNSLFWKIHISEFLKDIKKSLLSDLEPYVGNPQKNWQVWKPCSFPETAHTNLNQLLGITPNILGIPVWNYQWRYRFWWQIWNYCHIYCMCHVIQEIWSWKFCSLRKNKTEEEKEKQTRRN